MFATRSPPSAKAHVVASLINSASDKLDLPLAHVAICVPARNEAAELPALFGALESLDPGDETTFAICFLLDACTDDSVALVAAFAARSQHRVLYAEAPVTVANAGRARHRAMVMGMAASPADGLLLTTDADTLPSPDWLRAMVSALDLADLVSGCIKRRGKRPSRLQDRLECYYDALFAMRRRLDPVPWEASHTHHYCGGANIGIRRQAYEALGGFAPVASGEDALLFDDAARAGLRVRRDASCIVHTSDRRDGRASAGLATALRSLDSCDLTQIQVTHPADAMWQYRMQAAARAAFDNDSLSNFAGVVGLAYDHVCGVARDCPNSEAFAMRIVPIAPGGMRSVSLPIAEVELAKFVNVRQAA